jgi:N-acyl-D-aspartate/D-glutamate deacylase
MKSNLSSFVIAMMALSSISLPAFGQGPTVAYDLVIHGGRVIDPETGLNAIRDVGITGNTIAAVSSEELHGKRIFNADGLIVSPGFIDLHQHGQEAEDYRLKAFDGVTSALEMEIGARNVSTYLSERAGGTLINYGATANYDSARATAFHTPVPKGEILPHAGPGTNDPATPEQIQQIESILREQIQAGALGVGMGIQYVPGANRAEVIQIFQLAASYHLPVYTHVRSAGATDPGSIEAVGEVIAAAAVTGAPLHIVHINSSCLKLAPLCLQMVAGARARGLDVTTEAYPYVAGMTQINSALFNPGWQEKFGISYHDLALPDTGERLTRERFEQLHADPKPQGVLLFMNDDTTVDNDIRNPLIMIASDGERGHPREAGTYCRILARYVREQKSLTLSDAVRKMSFMPAQRLAASTPVGARKGRIQPGADADIVVFDLATVADRSTYSHPVETSTGMKYVLVQGVPIIEDGKLVSNKLPGRPITTTQH